MHAGSAIIPYKAQGKMVSVSEPLTQETATYRCTRITLGPR